MPGTSNTSATRMQHECDTNDTNATRECYMNDTSPTRVKNLDFGNGESKSIFLHQCIYYIARE